MMSQTHRSSTRFLASSLCSRRAACIHSFTESGRAATPRASSALAFSGVCGLGREACARGDENTAAEEQVRIAQACLGVLRCVDGRVMGCWTAAG